MNKLLILSALMLTVACAGCKKSSAPAFSGPYKGVVLFSVCAHTAIQTLGPNYLGEDSWAAGGGMYSLFRTVASLVITNRGILLVSMSLLLNRRTASTV